MINCRGYLIEFQGDGNYLKSEASDFESIKSLLKRLEPDGMVSVVRKRDNFEVYSGLVKRARVKFGCTIN